MMAYNFNGRKKELIKKNTTKCKIFIIGLEYFLLIFSIKK